MRFIAALMVFSLHVTAYLFIQPDADAWAVTFQLAAAGVSYFFILSGFILTWSAPAGDTVRGFWRRRFFKIYPNHLVTFFAALLILTLVVGRSVGNWAWLPNVLLVQSWSPELAVRGSFNQVAWSLSCEAAFYFSFPLLLWAVNKIRGDWLWVWAGGVVGAIFATPGIASATAPANALFLQEGVTSWDFYLVYQFPLIRMLEFVLGILVARLVMTGKWRSPGLVASAALVLASFWLTFEVPAPYRIVAVMAVPLAVLIAAGAVADASKRSTVFSSKPMVWLGEISYAFFMWHVLVLLCAYEWLIKGNQFNNAETLGIAAVMLVATVIVAWLQFTLVERPVMRRFARPRRLAKVAVLPDVSSKAA